MTSPLAKVGVLWGEMIDELFVFQADLLRRTAGELEAAFDRGAMIDIEGSREWRNL
jgi:hypothetical protein